MTAEYSGRHSDSRKGNDTNAVQIVVPVVFSLLVGVGLYYGLGAGASTTALAALALATLLVGAVRPRKKAVLKACVIIAVLCSLPLATRIIIKFTDKKNAHHLDPQPVSVQPSLDWSGPLGIGQTGAFTIPLRSGYSHARIQFDVQDANLQGPICSTDTELAVAVGPTNNPVPVEELKPGNWSIGIPLAGFTGTARVQVTIGTVLTGQRNCPVVVTIPSVILTSR